MKKSKTKQNNKKTQQQTKTPPKKLLCLLLSSQATTTRSLRAHKKSQGKMLWWPSETSIAPGCREQQKPTCHPEVRRKSHPDPIINVTGNTTISQAGKIPPLPFPVQSRPQRSPKGEEHIAPWHPFSSPAAAQISALHCAWSLFSRTLALASWKAAMQTRTTSAGLTSFQSFAPLPFPAHQLHSSHFSLCSSIFRLTLFPYPVLLFALFA